MYFIAHVLVSAIPAEGIPPDQTHQCRDFLLQGSTVQQTRGVCGGPYLIYVREREFSLLFSLKQLRTRSSLLENLQAELSTRSRCMMGDPSMSSLACAESTRGTSEGSGGFIENFKVSLKPCIPAWFDFIPSFFCSSEWSSLESHQSEEPLFWDSRRSKESQRKYITEAEGKIPPRTQTRLAGNKLQRLNWISFLDFFYRQRKTVRGEMKVVLKISFLTHLNNRCDVRLCLFPTVWEQLKIWDICKKIHKRKLLTKELREWYILLVLIPFVNI